ncbi:perforin-1-like [Scomber japonicus]|uniref:perforin-1-like n=1 Tax=Scomber japonicus TaxID=13676 RepID=UPI0023060142|nr:perforin-1-like [Scomber japonicus]
MTVMWQLLLLWWAWSPLCLSSSFIGTPQQCQKAQFVPGYNLGGEGFDIVKMQRKGAYVIDTETWKLDNGACRLYRNRYMNNENQKVPIAVEDWTSLPQCSLRVSSIDYDSVEAFVNDSTSAVTNDWETDLNFKVKPSNVFEPIHGGSHSKESTFAMGKSKEDHYSFFRHSVDCNFYRYRLAAKPPLSSEFESAVSSLPSYSSKTEPLYRNLINRFGTHYITQVSLGGEIKTVTALRTCQATMNGLSETEVKDCLSVEASAAFAHPNSNKPMIQHCEAKKKKLSIPSFSSMFNERTTEVIGGNLVGDDVLFQGQSGPSVYNTWLNSLKETPDVVRYNIKPLHTILPSGHPASAGLKQEVEKYIKKNAVLKKCSETCQIGHRSNKRDPCACVCNNNQNVKSNCCATGKGLATLTVYNLHAEGLYGDVTTQTDALVEVKCGDRVQRTVVIPNDDNPRWTETFVFHDISMDSKLRFSVYDEDSSSNNDLLGKCSTYLHKGKVSDSCTLNHGNLFFTYKVVCAPSLGGNQCQEYIPSPLNSTLAKVFYTRNGVLLGETGKQRAKSLKFRPAVELK